MITGLQAQLSRQWWWCNCSEGRSHATCKSVCDNGRVRAKLFRLSWQHNGSGSSSYVTCICLCCMYVNQWCASTVHNNTVWYGVVLYSQTTCTVRYHMVMVQCKRLEISLFCTKMVMFDSKTLHANTSLAYVHARNYEASIKKSTKTIWVKQQNAM